MGNISEQNCSRCIGSLTKLFIIPVAAIGGSTADDHFWFFSLSDFNNFIKINQPGFFFYTVENRMVKFSREIHRRSVGEVTSVGKVKSENLVAWFETGENNGRVGLGAGMRLHVGPTGIEQFFGAVYGDLFNFIHN